MVDWQGLLNWSLQYQDGTKPSQFKQMSEEDRKFIEDAFESVVLNEMKEIWKILDQFKTREGDSEKEIEDRVELIETLSNYIDGPENARNIIRGKRFIELIQYFFESKHKEVTIALGRVITSMMQNDGYIQKAAMDFGIFNFLTNLNESKDTELISMYIYMLTGILYGDELEVRKHFVINLKGVILLYNMLLKPKGNYKNYKRLLNIFADLTKITDVHAKEGITELRKDTLNIIKEIKLHHSFVLMLKDFDYTNIKNIDIIHVLFDNIVNVSELYDTTEEIFAQIKTMNGTINSSTVLSEEEKKEEKKYLMEVIKRVKTRINEIHSKSEEAKQDAPEMKIVNGKETMRIQIKK